MTAPERTPDELDRRIRTLEAERLRPLQERPLTDYQQLLRDAHDWVNRRYEQPDNEEAS